MTCLVVVTAEMAVMPETGSSSSSPPTTTPITATTTAAAAAAAAAAIIIIIIYYAEVEAVHGIIKAYKITQYNTNYTQNNNKKAQLSLTNPRDACENFAWFT